MSGTTTQAQIEAAAKVLNVSYENKAYAIKIAKAALTAAAEVGEPCGCGYDNPDDVCMVHEPIVKRHVAATIERCAQVVQNSYSPESDKDKLVAAIRALKDSQR